MGKNKKRNETVSQQMQTKCQYSKVTVPEKHQSGQYLLTVTFKLKV